jgi:hypothetical protein
VSSRLYSDAKAKAKRREDLAKQREEREMAECTFAPVSSSTTDGRAGAAKDRKGSITTRLYQDAMEQKRRKEEVEAKRIADEEAAIAAATAKTAAVGAGASVSDVANRLFEDAARKAEQRELLQQERNAQLDAAAQASIRAHESSATEVADRLYRAQLLGKDMPAEEEFEPM